ASSALPVVTLLDTNGNTVAKASTVESADRQCQFEWTSPADGTYQLQVRDVQHGIQGGEAWIYCLTFQTAKPDFTLSLANDFVNVTQGAKSEVDLIVNRSGGFAGPIDLSISGLPEGVTFEPARIPENQSRIKLVLSAADEARSQDSVLRIGGSAVI